MNSAKPLSAFAPVICTVDVVLLTLAKEALHVALLRRTAEPFAGQLALPGGFVHADEDETAWHAAGRVLRDKLGLASPYLEQIATWSGAARDPRGWSVSVVYCALVPLEQLERQALAPGVELHIVPVARPGKLPFDHRAIIDDVVHKVRAKSQYSSLPVYFCGERMTLPQLQAVYETVLGEPVNKVSFRRKIEELGMLEPVAGEMLAGAAHRPAQLYQLKKQYRRKLSLVQRGLNA